MKNFLITLALMSTVGIGLSQAQTVTDNWAFGVGVDFPRLYSVNITSLNSNYGAYLTLQRNFSEHVGLRLNGGYSHLEGQWSNSSLNLIKETTNLITGDLDLLYYLSPCEPVSPYLYAGVGGNYKMTKNGQTASQDENNFGSQLNVGTGAEFKLNPSWSIAADFGYHLTNNSELDGTISPIEVNGRDSYITLSVGIKFFFGNGKASKLCEPCQPMPMAMSDMTDYNRIEEMIVRHIPKEVTREVTKEITKEIPVDRYIFEISNDRLVLVGVNFAFDKSELLPESYPVLDKAVKMLSEKADVRVEIGGYTDYIGTVAYNQELSVERAQTVKSYLVLKGINENRLTAVGYGKFNPVKDNKTEEGRAMNRRIVFKIIK